MSRPLRIAAGGAAAVVAGLSVFILILIVVPAAFAAYVLHGSRKADVAAQAT
jgi:hypothetical protein